LGSKKINRVLWLSLIGIFILGYLVYRSKSESNKPESVFKTIGQHGPFSIQIKLTSFNQYSQNTGRDHQESLIKYSILYKDKPVTFSNNLQNNTGFSHLWRVYILVNAPTPTLIAGSQSLYMINEKDGLLHMEPLDEQGYEFATLQ
jgi:hypothetical protein